MALLRKLVYGAAGAGIGYCGWQMAQTRAEINRNKGVAKGKRFLVLGAGFGGVAVAKELARLLPDESNGEIVLIDEDSFLLFTPMLTEAAGGELDARHIVSPARRLPNRIRFVEGRVTAIDLNQKSVTVQSVGTGRNPAENDSVEKTYEADHIVIALGSVTNFRGIAGVAENSLPMKNLQDASAVCSRVLACLERAAQENDAETRKELLTFVVAGGGYTGVEAMAAINDLLRDSVEKYPKVERQDLRTVLVNPGNRLLSEITPELAAYAESKLQARGVEVRMNAEVTTAGPSYVQLKNGERIPTRTLIWAAGVKPNQIVDDLPCEKGKHGGIKVSGTCQVSGRQETWALGDCAEVPQPDGNGAYAPTAQNATREGTLTARNIVAQLSGTELKTFRYKPIGELALVGKHSGVARVWGHNFSGALAWAMWRAVYLAKMPSTSQKARIVGDWILDALLGREPMPLTWDAPPSQAEKRSN